METFKAISGRISVREYKAKPVDGAILKKLVDAARRAPTARGIEPWEFVVIREKETLQKIGDIALTGSFIKSAVACIAIFCKDTKYYLEDGCAATENLLILAADIGLGACWVAGDKKPYVKEISDIAGAKPGMKLVSLVSIGWPKKEVAQSKNRSLKDVIHWEKF